MAMRKEPHRRYPCASDLGDDLGRYLEGLPISARKDTTFYQGSKSIRRNRKLVIVAVLALMVGTGAVIGWDYLQAPHREVSSAPWIRFRLRAFPAMRLNPRSRRTARRSRLFGQVRTTTTRISTSAM